MSSLLRRLPAPLQRLLYGILRLLLPVFLRLFVRPSFSSGALLLAAAREKARAARAAGGPTATGAGPPAWLSQPSSGCGGATVTPLPLSPSLSGTGDAGCEAWSVVARGATAAAAGSPPPPTVLYFPGGAHILPPMAAHWVLALRLSHALGGAAVVVVDAPRAPVHSASAGLRAAERVLSAAIAAAPVGGRLVLAGDSAGGGLALALAQHVVATTKKRRAPIDALLLLCPWVDLAMLGAQPVIDDPMLSVAGLRDAGVMWAGIGSSPTSPLVSPLFGAMAGLPPCALFVARRDLLGPQGVQLAAALGAAGVRVRLRLGEHKLHVWPVIEIEAGLPEADEAVADMAEAVREMLAPAPASAASG